MRWGRVGERVLVPEIEQEQEGETTERKREVIAEVMKTKIVVSSLA
jgi:hypothetical protein